jgi:hypothetical protein
VKRLRHLLQGSQATGPGSSIVARSAWEPYRIAELLGIDDYNTFENFDIIFNLCQVVLSSIFEDVLALTVFRRRGEGRGEHENSENAPYVEKTRGKYSKLFMKPRKTTENLRKLLPTTHGTHSSCLPCPRPCLGAAWPCCSA